MRRVLVAIAALLSCVLGVFPVSAHPAPHSVILLDLHASTVDAELRLPVPELAAALGEPPTDEAARALVARDLRVASPDGGAWTVATKEVTHATDAQSEVIVVTATLTPAPDHSPRVMRITNDVIGRQVVSHVAWIGVRDDDAADARGGAPVFVGSTQYLRHELIVDRGVAVAHETHGFGAAVRLGAAHIAEGTDHLLFLLTLLLAAPLVFARDARGCARWGAARDTRGSLGQVLRIVTAFTMGHSLTLAMGALGWARIPTAPVEMLIALSIMASAVHAIRPIFPGREALIAGGFGLVHGLAFASALAELYLHGGALTQTLLGFNAGIELMQLAIIALTFPWLAIIARSSLSTPFRMAGAVSAGLAAAGWAAERAFGVTSPLSGVVASLASHPFALLLALALLALLARQRSPLDATEMDRSIAR